MMKKRSTVFSSARLVLCVIGLVSMVTTASTQDPLFAPAVNYGVGMSPRSVFSADLDGDSDYDLAVANYGSDNVSILLNNGDGTFAAAANYGAGDHPVSVFSADLDGDNDNDLAVANYGSDNVSILLNNGDGTFAAAVSYEAGLIISSVFSADFDGDNDQDLAVGNEILIVSILFNNGDGTFAAPVSYEAGYFSSVFSADLDGDNDHDLAVANLGSNNVSILLNNGDGTFAAAVNYWTLNPLSVFSADLDGDNDNDLAVANVANPDGNVSILLNNGDGTFAAAVNYGAGYNAPSVFAADLDGDSDFDLAVGNSDSDNVFILLNNGDGTFAEAVDYGAGYGPLSVFSADLDGDGDFDLAVANSWDDNVSILINLSPSPQPGGIAGTVTSAGTGEPIQGANVYLFPMFWYSDKTDGQGEYEIKNLPAGFYDVWITASGYEGSQAPNVEVLEGQTTIVDFALNPKPPNLKLEKWYLVDSDHCVSSGDHADLVLEFFNEGGPATNIDVELTCVQSPDRCSLLFYDPSAQQWLESYSFTIDNVGAYNSAIHEVEVYTTIVDPDLFPQGNLLPDDPVLSVTSPSHPALNCTETINLCGVIFGQLELPPQFYELSSDVTMTELDCIHHPTDFGIARYAQFAVANPEASELVHDPDSREEAIRALCRRVSQNAEFHYNDQNPNDPIRQKDIVILDRRHGDIGVCHNYMDLCTGLLRSLGLQTRDVWGTFNHNAGLTYHAWNEVLVDENNNQDSWIHVDATNNFFDNKQVYVQLAGGTACNVYGDIVPMSNASISLSDHDSDIKGVQECSPGGIFECFICWLIHSGSSLCAEDITDEYQDNIGRHKSFSDHGNTMVTLTITAPISVEVGSWFALEAEITNAEDSIVYGINVYVSEKVWMFDSLDTYYMVNASLRIDSVLPGSIDTVQWQVKALKPGSPTPLTVHLWDDSLTFYRSRSVFQCVNESGTLPDLVMNVTASPSLAEPGETVDLLAIVLDDSLQEDTSTTVTAYVTSETNPGFDDTVTLAYSESDSAYTGYLSLPSSTPVGDYRCRFIAEETGFDSDSVITYFSVAAILSVEAVSDSSVYDCRDTVSISATLLDRADTVV